MQAISIFVLCLAFFCQSTVADNDLKHPKPAQSETAISEEVDAYVVVDPVPTGSTIYASSSVIPGEGTKTRKVSHRPTRSPTKHPKTSTQGEHHKTTDKHSHRPIKSPTKHSFAVKSGRENIEKFLIDFFVFENSIIRDHKVGTDNEIFEGKGLGYDDYIFHSMIGSIVQAGPQTRAWNIPNAHTCHGLKKIYQYFNHTDQTHRLTLNYLDVNNIGDRQPIGLCAPKLNVCGADLPLYVYSGTHLTANNKTKTNYFFTNTSNYEFAPDKRNYKLVNDGKPLCYIYTRSEERQQEDERKSTTQNIRLRNLAAYIVPIYEYTDGLIAWYSPKSTENDELFKRHAYNVVKDALYIVDDCKDNNPVYQLTYDKVVSPNFSYSYALSTNTTGFEDLKEHSPWKYLKEDNLLGNGLSKRCGGRIKYQLYQQKPKKEDLPPLVYVARAGQKWKPEDKSYRNGFFFSV